MRNIREIRLTFKVDMYTITLYIRERGRFFQKSGDVFPTKHRRKIYKE